MNSGNTNPYDFSDDFARINETIGLNWDRINERINDSYYGYLSYDDYKIRTLESEVATLRNDINGLILRLDELLKEFNEMKKAQGFTYVDLENDG